MLKWRSLLLGVAISAVCVWLLLRTVDLSRTGEALASASPVWIGISLVTILVAIVLRCWRWQLLFLPADHVSLRGTISATMIGYMLNTVLPGRVGELGRAALVGRTEQVSTVRALGTILVEKILDVLVLLVVLGGLTAFLPLPPEVTSLGATAAVVFGIAAAVFFLLSNYRAPVVVWTRRFVDTAPIVGRARPSRLADLVLSSADSMRQPRLLAAHLVMAPLMWLTAYFTVETVLRAFALDLPWTAPALLLVLTNLGMVVPSAPGYVGVYHGIAVFALTPFGVDPGTALALALALHALGFGTFLLGGAAILTVGIFRQEYAIEDLWRWRQPSAVEQQPAMEPR